MNVRIALGRSRLDHLTLLLNKVVKFSLAVSGPICECEHKIFFSWREHKVLVRRVIPAGISDVINIELTCK